MNYYLINKKVLNKLTFNLYKTKNGKLNYLKKSNLV